MRPTRYGQCSCREAIVELLEDDQPYTDEQIIAACVYWSPVTVINTLSTLISEGAIVRTVTVTFQTAENRRKSNG